MVERGMQFKVGIVVLSTLLIMAILIALSSDTEWFRLGGQYQVQVRLPRAPGIERDTPVRKNGIRIGRVAEVRETDEGALVIVNVNADRGLRPSDICTAKASFLGDAVLEFDSGLPPVAQEFVQAGHTFEGVVSDSPIDVVANLQGDLSQAVQAVGLAGREIETLAGRINAILDGQTVSQTKDLISTTYQAMTTLSSTLESIDRLINDEAFQRGIADIPALVSDTRETMEVLERAVAAADENLSNLAGFTGPLGERGDAIAAALETSADNMSGLLEQIALAVKAFNSSSGTVGMLINDRELYDNLNMTVRQAREMIANLEVMSRQLRPILYDVRVLTDKVSRDPSRVIWRRDSSIK